MAKLREDNSGTLIYFAQAQYCGLSSIRHQENELPPTQSNGSVLDKLQRDLLRHRTALVGSLIVFVFFVGTMLFIQRNMSEAARRDKGEVLNTVVETSQQALLSWFEEQQADAQIFADSDEVRSFAKNLLKTGRNQAELLGSPSLVELRRWMAPVLSAKNYFGFFLVDLNGINIASVRDSNLGMENLLALQGEYLKDLRKGKSLLSLPLRSDVPLEDEKGTLVHGVPTMFVGAPVRDYDSSILAVLLFRIDPQDDFYPILHRGRIGRSGETYAFDASGKMISASRFLPQLREAGLLDQEASDSLGVELRDPGANVMRGPITFLPLKERPLTAMASSATAGNSGSNLNGYRDYRGVLVIGSWLWIDELNIGLTTEMDVEAAYASLQNNLFVMRVYTFVVVVMFVSLLMISSLSRVRTISDEKRYRSLFDNASDAILIADPVTGKLIDVSRKAVDELLFDRSELLDMTIFDLLSNEQGEVARVVLERLKKETSVIQEMDLLRKDGSSFCAEISANLASLDGGLVCQAFIRNVTKRKALEEKLVQSQRLETIGTLASGVAHDFNNMLMPIIGNAQLIARSVEKGDSIETYADRIIGAGKRAADIVRQLMTFGDKLEPNFSAVELSRLVKEVARLVRSSRSANITLSTDLSDTEVIISADAGRIHQVIMNLCVNALYAMDDDGGELKISLRTIEIDEDSLHRIEGLDNGVYAVISVSDTGHGMDETVKQRMFDPFFSTKEEGKGTGLGLSIAKDIIKSHGGQIVVTSEPGFGSTFNVYLPVIRRHSNVNDLVDSGIVGGDECILMVDDDVEITNMMGDMLEQMGYRVISKNNGNDALNAFTDGLQNIDLVITDFSMPHLTGDVLSMRLREIRHDIPIIIMTGFADALAKTDPEGRSYDVLLHKPFRQWELSSAIRQLLD